MTRPVIHLLILVFALGYMLGLITHEDGVAVLVTHFVFILVAWRVAQWGIGRRRRRRRRPVTLAERGRRHLGRP